MTFSFSGLSCDFDEVSGYEDYKWPRKYEMEVSRLLYGQNYLTEQICLNHGICVWEL